MSVFVIYLKMSLIYKYIIYLFLLTNIVKITIVAKETPNHIP